MSKPKRTADEYVHLNKKIINKEDRALLATLSEEWNVTDKEAAYRLLYEAMKRERDRRKNLSSK